MTIVAILLGGAAAGIVLGIGGVYWQLTRSGDLDIAW